MVNMAAWSMTSYERSELDKLLEPLTESAKCAVYDVFEEWHERVKADALARSRERLKCEIISGIASDY